MNIKEKRTPGPRTAQCPICRTTVLDKVMVHLLDRYCLTNLCCAADVDLLTYRKSPRYGYSGGDVGINGITTLDRTKFVLDRSC